MRIINFYDYFNLKNDKILKMIFNYFKYCIDTCMFAFCRLCDVLFGLLILDTCVVILFECGISFTTFPTALVRPSLKTILCPGFIYSGCLINLKCTKALSPVLRQSWDIDNIEAVCLILPQCTAIILEVIELYDKNYKKY